MKTTQKIYEMLATFDEEKTSIEKNEDLSSSGKAKRFAALDVAKRAALDNAVDQLRQEAVSHAVNYIKLDSSKQLVGEIEAEKLDWSRLKYEADAVRSCVAASGGDVYQLEQAFQKVKASNDKYKSKAWLDVFPGIIPDAALNLKDWQALLQDVKNHNDNLLTEDQRAFEADKKAVINELQAVTSAAVDVAQAVGASEAVVLGRVFDGIKSTESGLETDFDVWKYEDEEDLISDLELQYNEKVEAQKAVTESFGMENYVPNFDGVMS
jgi:hypothetical protein